MAESPDTDDGAAAPAAPSAPSTPSTPATVTRACSRCGVTAEAPEGGLPLGWSFAVEERGTVYQCQPCIRGNIRAIEGKLPQEYWEF